MVLSYEDCPRPVTFLIRKRRHHFRRRSSGSDYRRQSFQNRHRIRGMLIVASPFRYKVELDSIAGSAGAAGRSRAAARYYSLAVTGA